MAEAALLEAYRTMKEKDEIRTAEREAEVVARKKMEEALREKESRENARARALRRRAEVRMKRKEAGMGPSDAGADSQKLLQELQVYQIELEMQNEELMTSNNKFDALLTKYLDSYDFAPIGYFTLNSAGTILQVNLTGAGIERSRLTGQQFRNHVSDKALPTLNMFIKKTFKGEATESCEVELKNGEGPSRFVQLEARLSEDGKECNLVMIDITDRRRAEAALDQRTAQLESINKELESFSYSVSHDLRAPLRAIDGFSRRLIDKYGDKLDEGGKRLINVICSNTERMGILIDDLLAFSRVIGNSMKIVEIDVHKLADEICDEIRAANQERELDVRITKVHPGFGDRALVRQVLFNLFSNAVKFTRDRNPATIEMSSYKESDQVVYCLKDNGVGFDMKYYDKLFGVFQRLHSHEEYEGTGVGLAIVQRIINRHGGRTWAEGKENKGATFYFTLPQKIDGFTL